MRAAVAARIARADGHGDGRPTRPAKCSLLQGVEWGAEWRAELTKILSHWVSEKKRAGFLLDAPPDYLAVADQSTAALHRDVIAAHVRATIVEPMHALGAAVFAEMYNLQVPTIAKMIDGGRNTDMGGHGAPVVAGFPSKLARMVSAANASGLEALLQTPPNACPMPA